MVRVLWWTLAEIHSNSSQEFWTIMQNCQGRNALHTFPINYIESFQWRIHFFKAFFWTMNWAIQNVKFRFSPNTLAYGFFGGRALYSPTWFVYICFKGLVACDPWCILGLPEEIPSQSLRCLSGRKWWDEQWKNPGWLSYVGGYTTQSYRDQNKPL